MANISGVLSYGGRWQPYINMAKNDYSIGTLKSDVEWLKRTQGEHGDKLDLLLAKHNEHKGIRKIAVVLLGFAGGIVGHLASVWGSNQ